MKNKEELFEERLKKFALSCGSLINLLPRTQQNIEYLRQLIRSSASIGANYSEAICALTRKDFAHDINKSRKEAKESNYWLDLLKHTNPQSVSILEPLLNESYELVKIFQKSANTLRKNSK